MDRVFIKGLPVSGGIGIGEIFLFEQQYRKTEKAENCGYKIEHELSKLDSAIKKTICEIFELKNDLVKKFDDQGESIFDVYKTILEDKYFIDEIKRLMEGKKLYAEDAVDICFKKYSREIGGSGNEYAKQRIYDLNDICSRIMYNITGIYENNLTDLKRKHIVPVNELTPSLAAAIGAGKITGVIAQEGAAYFSHSAIVLRSLTIPALYNINYTYLKKFQGCTAIIDGNEGILIINPEKSEHDRYKTSLVRSKQQKKAYVKQRMKPPVSKDGYRVGVTASIGSLEECDAVKGKHVDGIGLVRTEILFARYGKMPDEDIQYEIYKKIVNKISGKPVVFRTADIGGDKAFGFIDAKKEFSSAGLRGLKRSLKQKDQFAVQIRAVIRSAEYGAVGISFPMVENAIEIKKTKDIIKALYLELREGNKISASHINIGAMIETKAGIENIDAILNEVDFINIGTNDLLHQITGCGRERLVTSGNDYLEPSFLRAVNECILRAAAKGKNTSICGEMAADPVASILLVGMGADGLSVTPARLPDTAHTIRKIKITEARVMVKSALAMNNAEDIRKMVKAWMEIRKV